ncbi:hypothetical protein MCEHALHM7_00877 [Methylophilaceae bacterium]
MTFRDKKINYKKIYFLGKSKKIISVFSRIFRVKEMEIIPWRDCKNYKFRYSNLSKKDASIIVVCGYDYKSYWYEYSKYLQCNILEPLKIINKISNSKTIIFYINTVNNRGNKTYSRYRYAKFLLGEKLSKKFKYFKSISPSVLVNNNGVADIYGGLIYKLIFNTLIYMKVIETCNSSELNKMILFSIKKHSNHKLKKIDPIFLKIRRTLFIDRLLRFIYG